MLNVLGMSFHRQFSDVRTDPAMRSLAEISLLQSLVSVIMQPLGVPRSLF